MDMEFDALVIGAGAGGCYAIARLAHAGYKTLLVESLGHIGGRASIREVSGFLINAGALCMEPGGMVDQTLQEVDESVDLYRPTPETVRVFGDRHLNFSNGIASVLRTIFTKAFAGLAVSNTGPLLTTKLIASKDQPRGYAKSLSEAIAPGALITANFASQTPLTKFPGLALYAASRSLSYGANLSDPAQKRAPAGW